MSVHFFLPLYWLVAFVLSHAPESGWLLLYFLVFLKVWALDAQPIPVTCSNCWCHFFLCTPQLMLPDSWFYVCIRRCYIPSIPECPKPYFAVLTNSDSATLGSVLHTQMVNTTKWKSKKPKNKTKKHTPKLRMINTATAKLLAQPNKQKPKTAKWLTQPWPND